MLVNDKLLALEKSMSESLDRVAKLENLLNVATEARSAEEKERERCESYGESAQRMMHA